MTQDDEQKQEFHKLARRTGSGEDENGPYDIIPLSMVRGGELKPFNVYTSPRRHLVKDTTPAPRGWYKAKNEPKSKRPRPCYTEALLTTPYGGFCPINCAHCYVNNGTRGYRATGLPVVHTEYPKAMSKWMKKIQVTGAAYITSFSEPFHPLEDEYAITYDLTQVFLREGIPLFYLSRQLPPAWAVDALQENPYSYMQWSINTSDEEQYRRFSPGSFSLEDVYTEMYILSSKGIFISIQCNPIIAGITRLEDLVTLVYNLADVGANHVIFKFVEQVANNRNVIVQRMHERGLPRVDEFDRIFNQVIGGVYTIQQDVRLEWLGVLLEETRKAGITMSLCYEYYDDGHAGSNLAPWFTTSDQCHGRGVPVYYRPEPGQPFTPLAGCYRKGCLYCSAYGTKACNNEVLVNAQALEYKDLRTIYVQPDEVISNWGEPDSCLSPEDCAAVGTELDWYSNPSLCTDAELWDWPTLGEVVDDD